MKKFFLALFYVFGFWFVPEVVKRIISIAQIEELFPFFLAVFGFWFIPKAAESISLAAKTGIRSYIITVLKISWIITVFLHQSTAGIATSIGLSVMYPPLCFLKKRRRYAEMIAISILMTVPFLYVFYLKNLARRIIICLILLGSVWWIIKNAIFVNSITKLFIDRDKDKF